MAFGIPSFSNPFGGSLPKPKPKANLNFQQLGNSQALYPNTPTSTAGYPGGFGPGGHSTNYKPGPNMTVTQPRVYDPIAAARAIAEQYRIDNASAFENFDAEELKRNQQIADIKAAAGGVSAAAADSARLQNLGVDLDFEQLGVDRATNARQTPLIDKLFGLREGQRGSERDYLKTLDSLGDKSLANQLAGADFTKSSDTRKARSDATARGAISTQGMRDTLSDIDKSFDLTTTQFKIERQREQAGIKARWDDNYFQGEIDRASTAEDKAKIADQHAGFDILEKRLNLSREQIANSLQRALADSNLSSVLSVGQVLEGLFSNSEQRAQLSVEILRRAKMDAATLEAAGVG